MIKTHKGQSQKSPQRMFSVYTVKEGNTRGRYMRYKSVLGKNGGYEKAATFVGNKDDATLFLRFEDARKVALSVLGLSGTGSSAFVVELVSGKIGKVHPVKEKQ